ncbi:MAG: methyltransferase domain-containing protein [Chloroflexota bacterium]
MIDYDEQLAKETERTYLMPEIAYQRTRTLSVLQLRAGECVLDVGCGMGLLARELAIAVGPEGRVVGMDNSASMIELAKKRCADFPQIELRAQSVESLPELDNCYDVVTCTQLLLYLPHVEYALTEMNRVLKPGGRIAVVETDWRGVLFNTMDDALTQRLFDGWESSIPSPHLPGQLLNLLGQAGFGAIHVEAIPLINTSYLSDNYSASMVEYMLRAEIDAGTISQADADEYIGDLKARSKAGTYFFCVNRFLFTGSKI